MKKTRFIRIIRSAAAALTAALVVGSVLPAASAEQYDVIGKYDYSITNPYSEVDWNTWKPYRMATHVHTVRSDGNIELNDMIEKYYELGYQGLALTDHGTVNYSWTKNQDRLALYGYQFFVHGKVDPLTEARYQQITTGSDRGGDGMTDIPLGIELNGSSSNKCHVNSYFADCGHGDMETSTTWPRTAVEKSHKAGGITHINHVGEWAEAKNDISVYNEKFISDFASIYMDYSSCVGMELVNTTDNRTRNDRYLYDETLKLLAPQGRNLFGFCEDDSHDYEDCANNAQFFVMPENNAANVRRSMETGAFFACSKNAKTDAELKDGFVAQGDFPMVSRIAVDDKKDTISVTPYNAKVVKMVADGVVIDERAVSSDNQTVTFDLNEYEDKINSYVRFYTMGDGGICYIQPFLLTKTESRTCTVRFWLPSDSATIEVKDSEGNLLNPVTADNRYIPQAGSYTYTAKLNGYENKSGEFTVTESDIENGTQLSFEISMNKIVLFSSRKDTVVDSEHHFIYGVEPGITDLSAYVRVESGGSMECTPTPNGFGTGTSVVVTHIQGTPRYYSLVIFGDVTGDGYYDGEDAFIVKLITAGLLTREYVGEAAWFAADCNRDGRIDELDAELLIKAGELLATVEQGEASAETSSAYSEYLALIDQGIDAEPQPDDESAGNNGQNQAGQDDSTGSVKGVFSKLWNLLVRLISKFF